MSRQRTREYIDVTLKEKEVARLKKGFTVHRWNVGKDKLCVAIKMKDRKVVKEIEKLKAKIKVLEGK